MKAIFLKNISPRLYSFTHVFFSKVQCPCCGWRGREFLEYRSIRNQLCPRCRSFPRHRFLYLLLQKIFAENDFGKNPKILHIAPEPLNIQKFLQEKARNNYLSIDITPGVAMKLMDITNLVAFGDNYFDFIFLSHVLEHVKKEKKSLAEIKRVLKPKNAIAIICVPIGWGRQKTIELTDDQIKKHTDHHVRDYGMDFFERVRNCGFDVEVTSSFTLSNEENKLYVLGPHWAAICRKSAQ